MALEQRPTFKTINWLAEVMKKHKFSEKAVSHFRTIIFGMRPGHDLAP